SYNDNSRYEGDYGSKPFANNHPGDDHDGYSQGGGYKNERTKELQDELDQVQNIVNQNLGKVMERGEHLENLQGKADRLQNQTKIFNSSATSASRTMRWRNMKWKIIIALTIIIIIVICVAAAALAVFVIITGQALEFFRICVRT
ncbi:Vesicle membrane receptor protein (v-SNARE), partial [Coemansia sp. IMI 209127]